MTSTQSQTWKERLNGRMREDWAREHHAKWVADVERQA